MDLDLGRLGIKRPALAEARSPPVERNDSDGTGRPHERLRALPEPVGGRVHGPRGRDREARPAYTPVQVVVNDLITLVAFAPVVKFLISGASVARGAFWLNYRRA